MAKLTAENIVALKARGYIDDEELVASAVDASGKAYVVCASGEIVTLVGNYGEYNKVFSDSTDRIKVIKVKTGMFKRTLVFEHNGTRYDLTVNGGKKLLEYFLLLSYGV